MKLPQATEHISQIFILRQLWIINYYSKSLSNNLSNESRNTGVSREISFLHFDSRVWSGGQQKYQCLCFHYWDYLTNFWHNNWQSLIDVVERLNFCRGLDCCLFLYLNRWLTCQIMAYHAIFLYCHQLSFYAYQAIKHYIKKQSVTM